MRILDVAPRTVYPPRDGAMVRIHHLLRYLGRNHTVRLYSQPSRAELRAPEYPSEVHVENTYLEYRSPDPIPAAAVQLLRRPHASGPALRLTRPRRLDEWFGWADVTLVEQPWQYGYCRSRRPPGPMVLASHNFEMVTSASNAEAAGVPPSLSLWYRYSVRAERAAARHADLVLAVSPEDRDGFIGVYGVDPDRVVVIPNAADTDRYHPVDADRKRELRDELGLPPGPMAVFLASKPSPPHAAALAWVERAAAAIPEMTFLVVGGLVSRAESRGNIVTTGRVEDPAPYLQSADIAFCPVQFGGGTKIKTLECVAAGLPTVAFAEAVHGTRLEHGRHAVICDPTEVEVLAALRRLAGSPDEGRGLAEAGRQLVVDNYDWKASGRLLEASLTELVAKSGSSLPRR